MLTDPSPSGSPWLATVRAPSTPCAESMGTVMNTDAPEQCWSSCQSAKETSLQGAKTRSNCAGPGSNGSTPSGVLNFFNHHWVL